jgi:hypothetical protein
MESLKKIHQNRNLSENIFNKTWIFQNGIFQKKSFRKRLYGPTGIIHSAKLPKFSAKPESFRVKPLRKNLSEKNLSEGIFQKRLYDPTGIIQIQKVVSERFFLKDSFLKDSGFGQKKF